MIEIKDSAVLRDGEQIGTLDGNTCRLLAMVGPNIKGQIRKAADLPELRFEVGFTSQKPLHVGQVMNTDTATVQVVANSAAFGIERLMALVEMGQIPPPPPTRPDMGDKTPEYVTWFKSHATAEEIAAKYKQRVTPSNAEADEGERLRRRKVDFAAGFDSTTGDPIDRSLEKGTHIKV